MKARIRYIFGILLLVLVLSCSMTGDLYSSKKLFERLYESNGNAFYIKSTNMSVSFVWSYAENKISIYKLFKGKVVDSRELSDTESNWLDQFSKKELAEVDSCLDLDGDVLGFKLKYGNSVVQNDLSIKLDCFVKKRLNSVFLNGMVGDMKAYRIKW